MTELFTCFSSGTIAHANCSTEVESLPWNPHPSLKGVNIKHLVTGKETEGRFSVHLVRLDAGAKISEHAHEKNWELHEVAGGGGYCEVEKKKVPYRPGVVTVLPENTKHNVLAGESGLLIMAKFIPALL